MATTIDHARARRPASQRLAGYALLCDEQGNFTLRRLRSWHRLLARCAAMRLDRELAAGARPETSALLAARAMQLTSVKSRHALAASLQRILAAAGQSPADVPWGTVAVHPPRVSLCRERISQSAGPLARLAGHLAVPGPVPVQGVAMASQLLADGTGPLYHAGCGDDLDDIIAKVTRALTA